MLFVSPFLALLLPFVFIRNVGWIWIGVFFQWLFYGPLFALFLGGLTAVWRSGIPFIFDFSRVTEDPTKCDPTGYVYPTAINILYGGPAQKLAVCNNGNYVDTFAEYIISMIMLWAVVFFPWWLLRIFRDYCCDGIMSMKNILLSMYDQMRGGPPFQPIGPAPASPSTSFGTALQMPKGIEVPVKVNLETVEQIKIAKTVDIAKSLNLNVNNLTDIARFETNNEVRNNMTKNLNFLQNPTKAETPTERQKYMNIRSELFSRAIKEDKSAKQILSSISTSRIEQVQKREELVKSMSQVPVTHVVSVKVNIPAEKVQSISSSLFNNVSQNNQIVNNIAQTTKLQTNQVKTVLNSLAQNSNQSTSNMINSVVQQTGIKKETVNNVVNSVAQNISQSTTSISERISKQTGIDKTQVNKVVNSLAQNISQTSNIVNTVTQKTGIGQDKVRSVSSSYFNGVSQNNQSVANIAQSTNVQTNEVKTILNSLAQTINKPETNIVNTISQQTGLEKEKITKVIQAATSANIVSQNSQIVNNIAQNTNTQVNEVKTVLNSLSQQNITQEQAAFTEKVSQQTGIEKEKVKKVVEVFSQTVKENKQLIKQIAKEQNIKEEQVEQIISDQIPTGPKAEKPIEQTISIPPSISIDEYEQVKKMWKDQYERGEVPVSDNIKSRNEWVNQDSVFITNILNKLVSDVPEIRQQGLDEIGYILPIFLLNNLKGDQLLVYLKAKLEAAKEIQEVLEQKEEAKAEVKAESEEELIDVEKPKAEEQEKTMEMKQEINEDVKEEPPKSSS
ncbi:hypothetical protein A2767_07460 [Candidatus Roizmanbacteria bacterium RIFCSPHIGHO2_01_FULL_35_10]|nr:MAG: hypothetical protein A2767_07460 [Candidatus Roizmanbacteria bacterium RIFCSPHIGHO2_01_FULL_35_10]